MIWRTVTLIAAGSISATITFWAIDREPPVVHTAKPAVVNPTVRPGGSLEIQYNLFRKKNCVTNINRLMYDAKGVRYVMDVTPSFSGVPLTGFEKFISKVTVPLSAAQGPARYVAASVYTCNPIHSLWPVKGDVTDLTFEIRGEPIRDAARDLLPP